MGARPFELGSQESLTVSSHWEAEISLVICQIVCCKQDQRKLGIHLIQKRPTNWST